MMEALNTPKLALHIVVGEGQAVQQILHPVKDMKEAVSVMEYIGKTPGFVTLAKGSDSPVMFHVRHVVIVRVVTLPDPVAAPRLAKLAQ